MADKDFVQLSLIAMGVGTTVGAALAMTFQHGAVTARTGVGVITVTLDVAVGFLNLAAVGGGYMFDFFCTTAGGLVGILVDTTDQIKTITMQTAAGAATESAFQFKFFRRLTR